MLRVSIGLFFQAAEGLFCYAFVLFRPIQGCALSSFRHVLMPTLRKSPGLEAPSPYVSVLLLGLLLLAIFGLLV